MQATGLSLLAWLLVAVLVERGQMVATAANYGAPWNGYGAIAGVLRRDSPAPMVYRVLAPWLVRLLMCLKIPALEAYEIIKIGLVWGVLASTAWIWGWQVAAILAVILPATFLYDYWDWCGEIIGINLALSGSLLLAAAGAVIFALSKETAPLSALAYGLKTFDLHGAVILLTLCALMHVIVHWIQGRHKLYCQRVMVKENWKALKEWRQMRPAFLSGIAMSVLLSLAALVAAPLSGWIGLVPLALLWAGWTLAKADETRVFAAVLPWVAAALVTFL